MHVGFESLLMLACVFRESSETSHLFESSLSFPFPRENHYASNTSDREFFLLATNIKMIKSQLSIEPD